MITQLSDEDAADIAIQHLVLCAGKSGGMPILHRVGDRFTEFVPCIDSYDGRELAVKVGDRLVIFRAHEVK